MLSWVTSSPVGDWGALSISSTGEHIFAYDSDGAKAYLSDDYGVTWNEVFPALGTLTTPFCIYSAMSDDGQTICVIATETFGTYYAFVTLDGGVSWSPTLSVSNNLDRVAMSADGSYMIIGCQMGSGTAPIYISNDSGQTWTNSAQSLRLTDVVMSGDGATVAFHREGSSVYVSTDYGANFLTQPAPTSSMNSLSINNDGSIIVALATFDMYTSVDLAASWVLNSARPNYAMIDGTGAHTVGAEFGAILTSEDLGATWTTQNETPDAISGRPLISRDGLRLVQRSIDYVYSANYDGSGGIPDPDIPVDGSAQINPGESVTIEVLPSDDDFFIPAFPRAGVAWSPTLKMFAGSVGTSIYTSVDGRTWTLAHTTVDTLGGPVAWGAGRFIVTGPEGLLYSSEDGIAWVHETFINFGTDFPYLGAGATMYAIGWNGSVFVGSFEADGANQILNSAWSTDGLIWFVSDLTYGITSRSPITWSPTLGLFVTAYDGFVHTSTNGKRWVSRSIDTEGTLGNVLWTGTNLVMVDSLGFVFTSTNATVWTKAPSALPLGDIQLVRIGSTTVGITAAHVLTTIDGGVWFTYDAPSISGSAVLATNDIRGYAFESSNTTIIYLSSTRLSMPSPYVLATDDVLSIGRAYALYMPVAQVTSIGHENSNARMTMPMPRLIAYGSTHGRAELVMPKFKLKATGHAVVPNSFHGVAPSAFALAYGGGTVKVKAPRAALVATGIVTLVGRAQITMPQFTLLASGTTGNVGTADLTLLHAFELRAYSGAVASMVLQDGFLVMASGRAGSVGSAYLTLPVFELVATGGPVGVNSAYLTMPMLRPVSSGTAYLTTGRYTLRALGHAVVAATYEAYAVNLLHGLDKNPNNQYQPSVNEVTHYTNYPFKQIVAFNGQYFGVSADGLHLLDGDTDAGEPIAWAFRTALTDFGQKKLKRVISAYIGGRMIEGAEVTLVVGETQDLEYTYTTPRSNKAQTYRVMFGKGVRTRYMALELADPLGKAIEVDSIEVENEVLERAI